MSEKRSLQVFRVLLSLIFLYAGSNHLLHPGKILGRLSQSKLFTLFPSEDFFMVNIILTGVLMVIAGLALAMNYRAKLAAAILFAILIPITLSVQLENLSHLGPFFKNVAISGALIFFINLKEHSHEQAA